MLRSVVNRYLFREFLVPILLCMLVFTLVLTAGRMVQLADLVINKGIALGDILSLLVTILPPLLLVIVPFAFLMGIMLGFGRLSDDGEVVALKAAGIGILDMARPVFLLALCSALLTLAITFWAAPWGYRAFRSTLFEITRKQATVALQPQVFQKKFSDMVLYTNDLDERSGEMTGVFIIHQQPENPLLIIAESGQVQSDPQLQSVTLRLRNGVIHRQNKDQRKDSYQAITFATYEISPDLSKSLANLASQQRIRPYQMGIDELWALTETESNLKWTAKGELHYRLCAPLSPVLFALFAIPFSTFTQRSGRGGGFTLGLLIFLAYNFLTSFARTLTVEVQAPPLLTFWIPHLILLAVGGYLLHQSARERTNPVVARVESWLVRIRQLRKRHAHY